MQDRTATTSMELQEKEKKDEKDVGKLIRKSSKKKGIY